MSQKQNNAPCLEVRHLVKTYGGRRVVDGLSFDVQRGEIVGLLGPNGAGKTTAFYMTVGLIRPDQGTFVFKGENVTPFPMHKRARMGMGYLAQEPSVFRYLTVEENILCILESLPMSHDDRMMRLEQLLSELHLEPLAKKKAIALSGGERNRVHLAKMLKEAANLLLLDEPTNDLDVNTLRALEEAILRFSGCAIVISHDRWFLNRIATHIIAFEDDSKVVFNEGNYQDYEEDLKKRLGVQSLTPHRVRYKKLTH